MCVSHSSPLSPCNLLVIPSPKSPFALARVTFTCSPLRLPLLPSFSSILCWRWSSTGQRETGTAITKKANHTQTHTHLSRCVLFNGIILVYDFLHVTPCVPDPARGESAVQRQTPKTAWAKCANEKRPSKFCHSLVVTLTRPLTEREGRRGLLEALFQLVLIA